MNTVINTYLSHIPYLDRTFVWRSVYQYHFVLGGGRLPSPEYHSKLSYIPQRSPNSGSFVY